MLAGERGEPVREALENQIAVGEFFGAERLVPVTQVHVTVDWEVMGDPGCELLEGIVERGGAVTVPTTRNAKSVDLEYAERLRQAPSLVAGERRVAELLRRMGVTMVDTCIGYQSLYQPHFHERVAWGDTGAAIYANAVLGARTNFESGTAGLAAALTGRVPEYGFHIDETRRPNAYCRVEAHLEDVADWGALGAVVGERLRDYWNVPLIETLHATASPDDLKHLGAALASYGSMAMFHVAGATPEAPSAEAALRGATIVEEHTITADDIDAVFGRTNREGESVDVVSFTAPQLSLFELRRLAELLDRRKVAVDTTLIVTTNAMTRSAAAAEGYINAIEEAGGLVLQGVCWYLMAPRQMRDEFGWRRLVTNSAKLANIIKAHGYEAVLRCTEDCVESAVAGRLVKR